MKSFFLIIFIPISLFAADDKKTQKSEDLKNPVTTFHEVIIAGKSLKYRATTGFITLNHNGKKDKAKIFYIAYKVDSEKPRPVTFSFNGGPGSSSIWMHMAFLGPKRVLMDDDGMALKPPAKVIDNDLSVLNKTDLVFIDPVGTGFSKPVGEAKQQEFSGVNEDISSISEFIEKYISANNRWQSPKFLIGESYGTFRASGLSNHLLDNHGMRLNGIMLISSVLNYQTISQSSENIQSYAHFLPSLAATAWYHNKLLPSYKQKSLVDFLKEVEGFVQSEYLLSLYKGNRLTSSEIDNVAAKVSAYTGLSQDFVKQQNLKISNYIFFKELLKDEGEIIGRFDGRYTGDVLHKGSQHTGYDPSYTHIHGPISEALNTYLRGDLKFNQKSPYGILTNVHPWNFPKNRYASISSSLNKAMIKNPYMKVFVASGYYDLATPYFATEYTFAQMNVPEEVRKNISIAYYEAGHMMYLHMPSFKKLVADLNKFLDSAL